MVLFSQVAMQMAISALVESGRLISSAFLLTEYQYYGLGINRIIILVGYYFDRTTKFYHNILI